MLDVWDVVCSGCGIFKMRYSGFGIFRIWFV